MQLEDDAAFLISEFIEDHPTLRHVKMWDNRLARANDDGVSEIANIARGNPLLQSLDFRANESSYEAGKAMLAMFDRTDSRTFEEDGRFKPHFDQWFDTQFGEDAFDTMTSAQLHKEEARYKVEFPEWMFLGSSNIEFLNMVPVKQMQLDQIDTLELCALQLGVGDVTMIAGLLKNCRSLTYLNLSSNFLTNVQFSTDLPEFQGIFALARVLQDESCTLQRLDIACTGLCGFDGRRLEGLDAISNACFENSKGALKKLSMHGNHIPGVKKEKILLMHAGHAAQLVMARLAKTEKHSKGASKKAAPISKNYLMAFNPNLLDICM